MDGQEPPVSPAIPFVAYASTPEVSPALRRAFERVQGGASVRSETITFGPFHTLHSVGNDGYQNQHGLQVRTVTLDNGQSYMVGRMNPNSLGKETVMIGRRWSLGQANIGPVNLELAGMAGVSSGYSSSIVPSMGLNVRAEFARVRIGTDRLSFGLEAFAMPYINTVDQGRWAKQDGNTYRWESDMKRRLGVVVTSAVISMKYTFGGAGAPLFKTPGRIDDTSARYAAQGDAYPVYGTAYLKQRTPQL